MSDEDPKCQENECGKPATHHIPEYEYKPTDVHLCEAHADEARSAAKHHLLRPVRRSRPRPQGK